MIEVLTTINKERSAFAKQALINYLGKDAGVIVCGLLIGVTVGSSWLLFLPQLVNITPLRKILVAKVNIFFIFPPYLKQTV